MAHEGKTLDSFYHGRIRCFQPLKGYRFAFDAPLLADFIQTRESDLLLEWGAGNGIISLLLSIKPFRHITAVEIQANLAGLARENVAFNHLQDRITIVEADLRRFKPGNRFDVVFSNPPYFRKGEARLSESEEKSIAKHELKCGISDIMRKTSEVLLPSGRAYFIFPVRRQDEFLKAAEEYALVQLTYREIRSREQDPPNLFLSRLALKEPKPETEPEILSPLVLYGPGGEYSAEAQEIFSGRSHG